MVPGFKKPQFLAEQTDEVAALNLSIHHDQIIYFESDNTVCKMDAHVCRNAIGKAATLLLIVDWKNLKSEKGFYGPGVVCNKACHAFRNIGHCFGAELSTEINKPDWLICFIRTYSTDSFNLEHQ